MEVKPELLLEVPNQPKPESKKKIELLTEIPKFYKLKDDKQMSLLITDCY